LTSAVRDTVGNGEGGAAAGRVPRLVLPGSRTIFVRESEWRSGTGLRLPAEEMRVLLRCLRSRDVSILTTLTQQHYLTTDQVTCLYFPSTRAAQMRLRWLTEQRLLLMRWRQLEPRDHGWRRRPSLYLLAERGAVVLARCLKVDARPLVNRSWVASEYGLHLDHDLEVKAFFVALAVASQDLPRRGPIPLGRAGQPSSELPGRGRRASADGWGRYLTPAGEVMFGLEWDLGTESPKRLVAKAGAYVSYFAEHPRAERNHILFVGPGPVREQSIRAAIDRAATRTDGSVRFWTTHTDLLRKRGSLGAVWLSLDGSERVSLPQMEGRPRTGRRVADCIGRPRWWERRPGAGEGA
jgi:Replication-relaxation